MGIGFGAGLLGAAIAPAAVAQGEAGAGNSRKARERGGR